LRARPPSDRQDGRDTLIHTPSQDSEKKGKKGKRREIAYVFVGSLHELRK
jgi:hypothetical protein